MTLKKIAINLLCNKAVQAVINPFVKNNAVIFMLHRFTSEKFSTIGHDPAFLSACLDYLQAAERNVVTLDDLFLSLIGKSDPINNAVVFTIDDGFLDQAQVGARIFCDHGLPVTICIVSQLIEQRYWLAESRIAYLLETTSKASLEIDFESYRFSFSLETANDRQSAIKEMIYCCKTLPLVEVDRLITEISESLAVNIPSEAPLKYRGMSLDDIRELESRGVTFSAHTEKHPALSVESDARSRMEITESFDSVMRHAKRPSQVFCYPTGRPAVDYTEREEQYVKEAGCIGGISAVPGYVNLTRNGSINIYSVPRFSFPDNMQDFKQIIHHLEIVKDALRGRVG